MKARKQQGNKEEQRKVERVTERQKERVNFVIRERIYRE